MSAILDMLPNSVWTGLGGLFIVLMLSVIISIGVDSANGKHFREISATLRDIQTELHDIRCLSDIKSLLSDIKYSTHELKDISSTLAVISISTAELDQNPQYTSFAKTLLGKLDELNDNICNLRRD